VPDTRTNRGAHPRDALDFGLEALPKLRTAADDLCWLLSRGYPKDSALKLVGDRYGLRARQRTALQRVAASDEERDLRRLKVVPPEALPAQELLVDGYNVLLTVETALGGGVVLLARDGVVRDMASMSGHYRRVKQTLPALELLGAFLDLHGPRRVLWLFDRPISNSGRLKKVIEQRAAAAGWPWEVELSANPDRELAASASIVASADSAVLDRCGRWVNLARLVVEGLVPGAWVVDLS
jgi:hypothetical protein